MPARIPGVIMNNILGILVTKNRSLIYINAR